MDNKEKKTGVTILLLMVIAMGILAATEGWLQDSTLQEGTLQAGTPDAAAAAAGARPASLQADSLPVPAPGSANEYPGIIRFHVIANSDSQKDQNIKYMVRNNVFCKLENQLTAAMLQAEADTAEQTWAAAADAADTAASASAALPDSPASETAAQTARAADHSAAVRAEASRAYIKAHLPEIEAWAQDCLRAAGCSYAARAQYGICAIPAKSYDDIYFPAGNYEALTITLGEGEGQNWWCVVFPPLCMVDAADSAYKDNFHVDAQGRLVLKSKIRELLDKRAVYETAAAGAQRPRALQKRIRTKSVYHRKRLSRVCRAFSCI